MGSHAIGRERSRGELLPGSQQPQNLLEWGGAQPVEILNGALQHFLASGQLVGDLGGGPPLPMLAFGVTARATTCRRGRWRASTPSTRPQTFWKNCALEADRGLEITVFGFHFGIQKEFKNEKMESND